MFGGLLTGMFVFELLAFSNVVAMTLYQMCSRVIYRPYCIGIGIDQFVYNILFTVPVGVLLYLFFLLVEVFLVCKNHWSRNVDRKIEQNILFPKTYFFVVTYAKQINQWFGKMSLYLLVGYLNLFVLFYIFNINQTDSLSSYIFQVIFRILAFKYLAVWIFDYVLNKQSETTIENKKTYNVNFLKVSKTLEMSVKQPISLDEFAMEYNDTPNMKHSNCWYLLINLTTVSLFLLLALKSIGVYGHFASLSWRLLTKIYLSLTTPLMLLKYSIALALLLFPLIIVSFTVLSSQKKISIINNSLKNIKIQIDTKLTYIFYAKAASWWAIKTINYVAILYFVIMFANIIVRLLSNTDFNGFFEVYDFICFYLVVRYLIIPFHNANLEITLFSLARRELQ